MAALSCILPSQGVQDNMTKLRMMSDRMCGANHFASEDLNHHIAKLNSRWVRHNELMGLRKRILEGATNFHQLQEKVMIDGTELLPKLMKLVWFTNAVMIGICVHSCIATLLCVH